MKRIALCLLVFSWLFYQPAFSQLNLTAIDTGATNNDSLKIIPPPKPRPSPMAVALYKEPSIYLKVSYCQPCRKGRTVFTELAPYGKLWRTGANEATEITVTKDVKLGGKNLKAGTYTLFTIPNADKWTIIFNSELGQWGEYKYDKAKDVLSLDVPSLKNTELYEAFTIQFSETLSGADMVLLWDNIKVVVPFTLSR